MDMIDIAAGVFGGVMLSAACLWGVIQFKKHDYRASGLAYGAFLMPIGFALLVLWGEALERQAPTISAEDRAYLESLGIETTELR
jgi:hypothetical protein